MIWWIMIFYSIYLEKIEPESNLEKLLQDGHEKTAIQNKCIKIISSTNTCEPSDYASLKLMTFKHIHDFFSLIRFFKYYKLSESQNFKTKINNHRTNHSDSTRHSMALNLNCPNLRLSKLKTSFLYNSIKF